MKQHTVKQKLLWIETAQIEVRAWHTNRGTTRGDGAWLRIAQKIEILEGPRPQTRFQLP